MCMVAHLPAPVNPVPRFKVYDMSRLIPVNGGISWQIPGAMMLFVCDEDDQPRIYPGGEILPANRVRNALLLARDETIIERFRDYSVHG